MDQELRLYTFVNFYLSSIQQGIQSAHVVHSLFVKYPTENRILWNWAINAKTMIVLNGGAYEDINRNYQLTSNCDLSFNGEKLPFECFSEDVPSLGGIMTSFGIVLPPQIYNAKRAIDVVDIGNDSDDYIYYNEIHGEQRTYSPLTPEHTFITMLKNCGLAR